MEPSVAPAGAEIKYCVVCGAGSHRTDWVNVSGDYVACDSHSKAEVNEAVALHLSESERQAKALKDAAAKIDAQVAADASSNAAQSTAPPTGQAAATPAPSGVQAKATKTAS